MLPMPEEKYSPIQVIGGKGGDNFEDYETLNEGEIIKELTVWAIDTKIRGFEFRRTDGYNNQYGHCTGHRNQNFSFERGEFITKLSLGENGNRLGWILFETSKHRKFDFGMWNRERSTEYEIDVGSGILMGFLGRSGVDIDALGFVFLASFPVSRVLIDVEYPGLGEDSAVIESTLLKSYHNTNNGTTARQWEFSGSQELTTSSSWSCTSGLEKFMDTHLSDRLKIIDGSVPSLSKAPISNLPILNTTRMSIGYGWETTKIESKSRLGWSHYGTLPPSGSISLEARTYKGDICTPFTGIMEVRLKNGTQLNYRANGEYKGVIYSTAHIKDTSSTP